MHWLINSERKNSTDTKRSYRQRQRRENTEQVCHHARRRHGVYPGLLERLHVWNRGLRILVQNNSPQSICQAHSILAGANYDAANHWFLELSNIRFIARLFVQTEFFHIAYHAYNCAPTFAAIQGNAFPGGILSGPVMARQTAVYHQNDRRLFVIRFLEGAATYQRNSERLKVVRASDPNSSHWHTLSFRNWTAFDDHLASPPHGVIGIHRIAG